MKAMFDCDQSMPFSDRLLAENGHALAVVSLGQIREGYCVLFSKEWAPNVRALPSDAAEGLLSLLQRVVAAVESMYGPVIVFEHGSVEPKCVTGCGVDHAHLHIVPGFDAQDVLERLSNRYSLRSRYQSVEQWLATSPPTAPLIMFSSEGAGTVTLEYGAHRTSQAVRRVLAEAAHTPNMWDWRSNPELGLVQRTHEKLSSLLCPTAQASKPHPCFSTSAS